MSIIQVDRTYKFKRKKYTYKDINYDHDGWADVNKYLPSDYDLCLLKTKNRTVPGWYAMGSWDGLKLRSCDDVIYWKLNKEYQT